MAAWVVGESRAICIITKGKGETGNNKAVELRLKMCVHRDLINWTLQITFGSLEFISIAAKTIKMSREEHPQIYVCVFLYFFKNIHFLIAGSCWNNVLAKYNSEGSKNIDALF